MRIYSLKPYRKHLAASLALASVVACAPTTLTSWKDPAYQGGPLRKVAVFVMAKDEDIRRFAEDQVVQNIPTGTEGVASYTLFTTLEQDRDKVKARLEREGFDGALVARPISLDKTQVYSPSVYSSGGFYSYYGYAYPQVTSGYYLEYTTAVVETQLYALPGGKLIWSGVSETIDPRSRADLAQEVVKTVSAELK